MGDVNPQGKGSQRGLTRAHAINVQECRDGSLLFQFMDTSAMDASCTPFLAAAAAEELRARGGVPRLSIADRDRPGGRPPHVHFLGIGGAGLGPLARLALAQGCTVSGSDMLQSARLQTLKEAGAVVVVGHSAENLQLCQEAADQGKRAAVVVSSAVPQDNPELLAARASGVPVYKRGEWLAHVTADKDLLAVAGTHGKTTTSSMLAVVLRNGFQDDLSAVIGSEVVDFPEGAAHLCGEAPTFVLEADEYDGAFLELEPLVAIVTNVEWEHVDVYPSAALVHAAFEEFAGKVRRGGLLLVCGDDPGARALAQLPLEGVRVVTYGSDYSNEWSVVNAVPNLEGGTDFVVVRAGRPLGRVSVPLPGLHNVLNALSVIAAAAMLDAADALGDGRSAVADVDFTSVSLDETRASAAVARAAEALGGFKGVARRFQQVAALPQCVIYDDYAHHPTEVRATIQAARQRHDTARIWVVFQPHTYSRLAQFFDDFVPAFGGAQRVLVTDVFGAREEAVERGGGEGGVWDAEALAEAIEGPAAAYMPTIQDAVERVVWELKASQLIGEQEPPVIISMGAGDITCLGERLVQRIKGEIEFLD